MVYDSENISNKEYADLVAEMCLKSGIKIVKPSNLSRGRGIYIVDDVSEVNLDEETAIVQWYVSDPLLINGHKFDLRIYVCVSSYEPLRIYVYKEGLARFASE